MAMRLARGLGWGLVATLGLSLAGAAAEAADAPYGGRAPRAYPGRYHRADVAPIGLPCEEEWGGNVILRCPPQIQVKPAEDDLAAWNALVGLDGAQHRPYRQLFSWSR